MENNLDRRLRIGLLMADFPKDQPFFSGVVAAARFYDANLFCITGKLLHWRDDFAYQGNVLYELVDVERLDGLITWAGEGVALGQLAGREEMQAFFERYAPLPIVNYEKPVPGLHFVRTDTAAAMKEMMRHLLGVHQRRRVLLLRGPLHHFETEERVRAYQEALAEFGLPDQPELTLPPVDWLVDFEAAIIRGLDESGLVPGRDFDAVAGTENYLACAAIRVLKARGWRVPEDVAVVGFNEAPENLATYPPLTTVNKPFFASGYNAFEVLLNVIAGKKTPFETLVPAELLLRSSCGCVSRAIADAAAGDSAWGDAPAVVDREGCWVLGEALASDLWLAAGPLVGLLPRDWIEKLWAAFLVDLRSGQRLAFVSALSELMYLAVGEQNNLPWNRVLSRLRAGVRPGLAGQDLAAAEALWQQARICIQEFSQQEQLRQSVAVDFRNRVLNQFAVSLSAAIDFQTLLDGIARDLPAMGIPSCYLCQYSDPAHPAGDARLILAYRDMQRLPLPPEGIVFPARQLVPEDLLPAGRRYAMVVEPLYFKERQLGFLVSEYSQGDELLLDFLQKQISSALDRLLTEQEVRESEERYHTLVDNLRELILVHRGGELLFANRAARLYSERWNRDQSLLEVILQESPRVAEKGRAPARTAGAAARTAEAAAKTAADTAKMAGAIAKPLVEAGAKAAAADSLEAGDYEIDVQDSAGGRRRMIVRTQEVFYNHEPAEQIILIDITERKRLEDHLYFMSTRDVLTGLYNRAFFEREMTRLQAGARPVSMIALDVDGLKQVNDRQGHAAGDELLRLASHALRSAFRGEDILARIGGDEFAVLLPQMDGRGMIKSIKRVRRCLEDINRAQSDFKVWLSIGGATALEGEDLLETLKQADQDMYREKALKKASQLRA